MKPQDIRELSTEEIVKRIAEEEREVQNLRFQHTVARLDDPLLLRRKRREIARLKTILNEKQSAEA